MINEKQTKLFAAARQIASENLRACHSDGKIKASLKNFSDFWARDTFWAIPGVLELGDFEIARQSLEYFLSYQRSDGKIPRKIALDFAALKYIFQRNFPRKIPRAIFSSNIPPFSSMDSNALFVIAFAAYIERTKDREFGKRYYSQVRNAAHWHEKHLRNGFVQEYGLSNWMDTIFKNGHVLYTNVVYAHSLEKMSVLADLLGENKDRQFFEKEYTVFQKLIEGKFWNGAWLDDEMGNHKNFDVAGNVLACWFEMVSQEKRKIILQKILTLREGKMLLPTVDPKYPRRKVNPILYFFGMQDYQNGVSWLWIDLLSIGALAQDGFSGEARKYFADICQIIVSNGAVHETYFADGTPYKAAHWESAVPFAWNSGVFLQIFEKLQK